MRAFLIQTVLGLEILFFIVVGCALVPYKIGCARSEAVAAVFISMPLKSLTEYKI